MSPTGNCTRDGRFPGRIRKRRPEDIGPGSERSQANATTPYWLMWLTGTIAFVLCIVAVVLWGINGASTLFDMMVALCT